uniref:Uncharacterized protein n=1 Tax=Acrobeloides nanus TaxID=290746 RepID=A0A914EJ67_9BILA
MIACDDNRNHTVLVEHYISSSIDLAIDWIHGLLFWADWGFKTTIANLSLPLSIALDIFNERVYWADYYTKTIDSVDYNGNDWRTILFLDTHIKYPHSLTIFEEKLYWIDWGQKGVLVMNKFNGTEVRKFESTIVLFNQNFQTNVINILVAMVPYAFQKAILPWDYLIHVFVLMDTREEKNQIRVL